MQKKLNSENIGELNEQIDNALIALNQANNIIITYHANPDGDAIGAGIALFYYLIKLGKRPLIISLDKTPNNLAFLRGAESICIYNSERDDRTISAADLIVFLDFNDITRIGKMQEVFTASKAKKLLIDHHLFPKEFVVAPLC